MGPGSGAVASVPGVAVMKTSLVLALGVTLACGLSGCATTADTASATPARAPSIMDEDAAYVAYVERIARRRGIQVQWVNVPHKSAKQVAAELGQQ